MAKPTVASIWIKSQQPQKCKCGCGGYIVVKEHHRQSGIPDYIHGHYSKIFNGMKGRKHSPDTLRKYSEDRNGVPKSEEHKKKIGIAHKGMNHTPDNNFKKGNLINVGRVQNEEIRKKRSESMMGHVVSDEARKKISAAHKGKHLSEEHKKKLSVAGKGKPHSEKWRERLSRTKRKQWKDPEFCKMMGKAWGMKPNKPETTILSILDEMYPGEWRYTGDFSFTINGKCPDFVNCNGQKKVIEFNGTYWHRNDIPGEREKIFSEFGYGTLVIWENEMKNIGLVIKNIKSFLEVS